MNRTLSQVHQVLVLFQVRLYTDQALSLTQMISHIFQRKQRENVADKSADIQKNDS